MATKTKTMLRIETALNEMTPEEYVEFMKPIAKRFIQQVMAADCLAPMLLETLQAQAVLVVAVGEARCIVRPSYREGEEQAKLVIDSMVELLDTGMKSVLSGGMDAFNRMRSVEDAAKPAAEAIADITIGTATSEELTVDACAETAEYDLSDD